MALAAAQLFGAQPYGSAPIRRDEDIAPQLPRNHKFNKRGPAPAPSMRFASEREAFSIIRHQAGFTTRQIEQIRAEWKRSIVRAKRDGRSPQLWTEALYSARDLRAALQSGAAQ